MKDSIPPAPFLAAFLAAWFLVQATVPLSLGVDLYTGGQLDSDGYTRLLRVRQLLEGGGWFDTTLTHANWPWGDSNHWTRPLDLLILLLAGPLIPIMGAEGALTAAGAAVSPLVHLAACLTMFWAAAPVVSREARVFAMPALLVQPGGLAYGTLGRADHHMLLVLLALVAIGLWLRTLAEPRAHRPAIGAGIACGLALWISPEGLLPMGIIFGAAGLAWIAGRQGMAKAGLRFTVAVAAVVVLAIAVERPPSEWRLVEHDRISASQLTMCAFASAFWIVAIILDGRRAGALTKAGFVAVAAPALMLLLARVHPGYFLGPGAHIDQSLDSLIMPHIEEFQPLFGWSIPALSGAMVQLGGALLAVPLLVMAWMKEERPGRRDGLILVLAALVTFAMLAGFQKRLVGYAGMAIALGLVPSIGLVFHRARDIPGPSLRRLVRVGGVGALLTGPLLIGVSLGLLPDAEGADPRGTHTQVESCHVPTIAEILAEPTRFGSGPRTIAVHINSGPEIAWRTGHRILAGPYHRSHHGILDLVEMFTTPIEADWIAHMVNREVELVLLCPDLDTEFLGTGPEESLYHRLVTGPLPPGFSRAELPDTLRLTGFRLFEFSSHPPDP